MGSIYAIMASGLTLIFGVMEVINFAHGDFMMIAMYITYCLFTFLKIDPFVSILFTTPIMFLLGVIVYKYFVKPISIISADATLLLTLGLSLVLVNISTFIFGTNYLWVKTSYCAKSIHLSNIIVSYSGGIASLVAICIIGFLFFFIKYSKTGYEIRASMQDRKGAQLVGINVDRVCAITFGLGTAMAGAAGSLVVHSMNLFPSVGMSFTLKSFVIVVFGGMGSIGGALLGGLILGVVESLWSVYYLPGYREAVSFLALVIIFLIRPSGLFGKYGV